jgi:hypothetical protein
MLLASMKSLDEMSKSDKEDQEGELGEQGAGRHVVTQDEIGQRILTALKKVSERFV